MIYFDNAASTPPNSDVVEIFNQALSNFYANPDATHSAGHKTLLAVQQAERDVLKLTKASDKAKIVWCGSATEALNLAILGLAKNFTSGEILTTKIEHKAVIEPAAVSGLKHRYLPLKSTGLLDLERIERENVINSETKIIALHHINNEIGVIEPILELAKLRDKLAPKAILILDAAQSFGKVAIDWQQLGLQALIATSHKIHGINGTAILQIDKKLILHPITVGGGQQENLRSGTLNSPGCIAFAAAAKIAHQKMLENNQQITTINQYIRFELEKIFGNDIIFHAESEISDPHILSFALPRYQGAILMRFLGAMDVIIGTGAACLAETNNASHVMTALGVSKNVAFATLRVSFGEQSTLEEAQIFIEKLQDAVNDY